MLKVNKGDIPHFGFLIFICGGFSNSGYIQLISLIIFILCSVKKIKFLSFNSLIMSQLYFSGFALLSFFWSPRIKELFTTNLGIMIAIVGILYSTYFFNSYLKDERSNKMIINVLLLSLLFLIIQLLIKVPLNYVLDYSYWDNYGMNKNIIGMNLALGAVLCFYIIYNKLSKNFLFKLLFAFFCVIVIISSSRKGLIILIGCISLYMIFSEKNAKLVRNIFIIVFAFALLYYFLRESPFLYSLIGEKMEKLFYIFEKSNISQNDDFSIWERTFFKTYAMSMFNKNVMTKIIGNGLNSFQSEMFRINYSNIAYSHCNYTELLCNFGVVGFIMYYFYKVQLLFRAFVKGLWRNESFFIIVLIISVIIEYGFVAYYNIFYQIFILYILFCIVNRQKYIKFNVVEKL